MGTRRYSLESKTGFNFAANLLYISSSIYEGDWDSIPHSHYCIEFFYVVSGAGQFQVEDKSFDVKPDDLVIINPHIKHTERSLRDSPLEYIAFGVENLRLDIGASHELQYQIYNLKNRREELLTIFNAIMKEMDQKDEGYEMLCLHYLSIFLIRMIRSFGNHLSVVVPEDVPAACGRVKRYIDNHYDENLSLNDLAALAHWDKYHLVHVFTRAYGISPINYLREKRIQVCKALLESSDHSITQIAQITGFSSQSYFSQSFRGSVGVSPLEYRKRAQKE